MIISVWLVFRPAIICNERYATFSSACAIVATYLMLLALTYAMPFPKEYFYYYDGMLLVLLYLFQYERLKPPTLVGQISSSTCIKIFNFNRS